MLILGCTVRGVQARVEIGLLHLLNTRCDPHDERHIVRMIDSFLFRKHLCIVFEKLDVNLFELLKRNAFKGLSLSTVQVRENTISDKSPQAFYFMVMTATSDTRFGAFRGSNFRRAFHRRPCGD